VKSTVAAGGATHTEENSANNTINNALDPEKPSGTPKDSEPIKLMNLRLPIRKDYSDS